MERLPGPELGRALQEFFVAEPWPLAGHEAGDLLAPARDGDLGPLRHLVEEGVEVLLHFGFVDRPHGLLHCQPTWRSDSKQCREKDTLPPRMRRRDLLKLGGLVITGAALAPRPARAQQSKRGGGVTLRAWDPPHFDPHLTIAYKTIVPTSFTHSRLVRHKAGPAIAPGKFKIEGDLAESWSQPNDTTYAR